MDFISTNGKNKLPIPCYEISYLELPIIVSILSQYTFSGASYSSSLNSYSLLFHKLIQEPAELLFYVTLSSVFCTANRVVTTAGTYCLHLQGQRVSQASSQYEEVTWALTAPYIGELRPSKNTLLFKTIKYNPTYFIGEKICALWSKHTDY
jgi:hypothetical protein